MGIAGSPGYEKESMDSKNEMMFGTPGLNSCPKDKYAVYHLARRAYVQAAFS